MNPKTLLAEPREWHFQPDLHTEMNSDEAHVIGQIDFSARMAIRDLIRVHGFSEARELVAGYLNDEANGRRGNV